MSDTLKKRIEKYKDKVRFHTPSHAGKLSIYDITETSYSDNLLFSFDILKNLEEKIAKIYKKDVAFISTQGATFSIFQAVYALLNRGAFLVVGNCHISVFNALRNLNAESYHIDKFNLDNLEKLNIKTVIITSPSYLGTNENIEYIYKECKKRDIKLIVDSAHGSHFNFSSQLTKDNIILADLVICSLHKTLPVITGGSILLASNEFKDRLNAYRKMNHSTSPNYLTMVSIEECMDKYLIKGESIYKRIISTCNGLKKDINKLNLKSEIRFLDNDDKTRLVILSKDTGINLYNHLFKCGFVCESVISNGVILIVNEYNYGSLPNLKEALISFKAKKSKEINNTIVNKHNEETKIITYKNINPKLVPINEAINKRAFFDIGMYPPGTPIIFAGDIIKKEDILNIINNQNKLEVFGIENGNIYIIEEINN